MEQPRPADVGDVAARQAHAGRRKRPGVAGHAAASATPCSGLLASTMSANAEAIRSRSCVVGHRAHAAGLERHRPADEVGRGELVEQAASRRQSSSASGDVRVVPVPRRSRRTRTATARPRVDTKMSRPWQAARIRASGSISVRAEAARLAAAVPVLVQVVDRLADRLAEAGLAGDRRAALAAQLLDLVLLAHPGEADADEAAEPERQGLGRGQVPDRERGVGEDPALGRSPGGP